MLVSPPFRVAMMAILLLMVVLLGIIGGPTNAGDVAMISSLAHFRFEHPQLTSLVVLLTQAGSVYGTLGLGLIGVAWLWRSGETARAWLLAIGIGGERLALDGFKLLVVRPRPMLNLPVVETHSYSFPSGHAANSMASFMLIALLAAPPRYRTAALSVAAVLAFCMGATRPYLGVHWPSDVLAGWSFGLMVVLAVSLFPAARGFSRAGNEA